MTADAANEPRQRTGIDVAGVFQRYPVTSKITGNPQDIPEIESPFHSLYRNRAAPLETRRWSYHTLRRSCIDISWYTAFAGYWHKVLGNRPMWGPHDFFSTRHELRMRFGSLEVEDGVDPNGHLAAWQRPETAALLLHCVNKQIEVDCLDTVTLIEKLAGSFHNLTMLEFGCSTAPVLDTIFDFYPMPASLKYFIADLEALPFHYGAYKYRQYANVIPLPLYPIDDFALHCPESCDVIFCHTVFEHLNKPLKTVQSFTETLKRGGVLSFDYIKSDGAGYDTVHGARERTMVLDYIADNYNIIVGQVNKEESIGLTFAQKR